MRHLKLGPVIVSGLVLGLVIPATLGTLYRLEGQKVNLRQELEAELKRTSQILALGMTEPLWVINTDAAKPLVEAIEKDPRILSIEVFDSKGGLFSEAFKAGEDPKTFDYGKVPTVVTANTPVIAGTDSAVPPSAPESTSSSSTGTGSPGQALSAQQSFEGSISPVAASDGTPPAAPAETSPVVTAETSPVVTAETSPVVTAETSPAAIAVEKGIVVVQSNLIIEKDILRENEKIGNVRVRMSMREMEEDLAGQVRSTVLTILTQLVVSILLLSYLMNNKVLAPIKRLVMEAGKLSRKELTHQFHWTSKDEMGELGRSLDGARQALKDLFLEIEKKNEELLGINQHLEEIVEERTHTIRIILNNVRSGFFLADADCRVREGFTRSCLELFGKDFSANSELREVLCLNEKDAFNVKFLLAQVFEDILPEDIALDQVPKNFNVGNKILSLEGNVVRNAKGEVENILFTVNDVTQLRAAEEESKLTRTLLGILQQMEAFRNFLAECKQQLVQARSSLGAKNESGVRSSLHTLKGNSASFGLVEIASIIHKIEDDQEILKEHIDLIETHYRDFLHRHVDILKIEFDTAQGEVFEIRAEQLESFSHRLHSGLPPEAFLNEFDHWFENLRLRPARVLLGPLAESCVRLASRLGKNVRVEIEGGNVLVDKEVMGPTLSNLIHLCRNSLDHGLEEIYERGTKPEQALLKVIFSESESHWEIEIIDDGRGIDANNVARKALEMGVVTPEALQKMTYDEKCHLIFESGLSTAESVSDISGRGVGMSAMESVVRETGGEILVHSTLGQGTSFKIRVPRHHAHFEIDKSKNLLRIAS